MLAAERLAATKPVAPSGPRWGALGGRTLGWLLPIAIAIVWEGLARLGLIEVRLFPPPSAVASALWALAADGQLKHHVAATLGRVAAGFALGVAAGTALGALTGYSRTAREALDPTIQALRNIPSIGWVPLFVLWFGIFEAPKVMLIATGVFFPVYLGLMSGIAGVDRKLVEVGRIYRFSDVEMIRRILLPGALPAFLTGVRGGLGLGWMFVIAAELMGASEGLGYLMVDGQMTGNAALILGSLVLFAILGKASDALLVRATQPLLRWQDGFQGRV